MYALFGTVTWMAGSFETFLASSCMSLKSVLVVVMNGVAGDEIFSPSIVTESALASVIVWSAYNNLPILY